MLKQILNWLKAHRAFHVFLLTITYIFFVRGHMFISKPFYWLVKQTNNAKANVILLSIIAPLLLLSGYYLLKGIKTHPHLRELSIYWSLALGGSIISFNTLMPYNAEFMHFPQYMIIALLILPLLQNAGLTLIFSALLGFLDELAQYLLFFSIHFDYNDVCLDLFGAALGILVGLTLFSDYEIVPRPWPKIFGHPLYLIWNLLIILIACLFAFKVLVHFCDEGPWSWHRREAERTPFAWWEYKKWGAVWHRIWPYEGTFWLLVLPLLFYRWHYIQLFKSTNVRDETLVKSI